MWWLQLVDAKRTATRNNISVVRLIELHKFDSIAFYQRTIELSIKKPNQILNY